MTQKFNDDDDEELYGDFDSFLFRPRQASVVNRNKLATNLYLSQNDKLKLQTLASEHDMTMSAYVSWLISHKRTKKKLPRVAR